MSFIRRADGVVVYNGGHIGSRGTLSSIRCGESDDYFSQISEEDTEWERQVLASAITFYDGITNDYFEQDEDFGTTGVIRKLWGIYDRTYCPHLKVGFIEDEGCFRRKE